MLLEHLHVDTVLFIVLKVIKTQLKGVQVNQGNLLAHCNWKDEG